MADKKQTKVYLIPEGETRDSHTYHYTAIKTRKFTLENKKMRLNLRQKSQQDFPLKSTPRLFRDVCARNSKREKNKYTNLRVDYRKSEDKTKRRNQRKPKVANQVMKNKRKMKNQKNKRK